VNGRVTLTNEVLCFIGYSIRPGGKRSIVLGFIKGQNVPLRFVRFFSYFYLHMKIAYFPQVLSLHNFPNYKKEMEQCLLSTAPSLYDA